MADQSDEHRLDHERRIHPRVPLHWPISILQKHENAQVLSTVTENLSSQGFCCEVDQPLTAGERLQCVLKLPCRAETLGGQALRCHAQVVWVSPREDGRFGIGCQIHDYTIAGLEPGWK